jgi:aminopeptidase N
VEYPGIVVIADRLYDGNAASTPWLESTVAHEVAHQWFYGLVGSDQLGAPWLDESLTQYMTLRYFRERYGPAGAAGFQQSLIERWDRVGNAPIPIGRAVSAYTAAEYGAIIYGRGALFFLALEEALGPSAFDAFLSDYVRARWLRIGDRDDLEAAAEAACGCTLDALFAAWVDDGS